MYLHSPYKITKFLPFVPLLFWIVSERAAPRDSEQQIFLLLHVLTDVLWNDRKCRYFGIFFGYF